ncbi:MAG: hypothetical protein RL091_267 [Verrucomicrobiota bacterium]|jgi:hypothetical protein
MELRRHLLIGAALFAAAGAFGEIKRYPLDDRASYLIAISPEAPTTVLFPDKITALDGANLSAKPDEAPVQLAHQPGANYFSVRALQPDAHAAVNVLLRGQVFALEFRTGSTPDRTVTFYDTAAEGGPAKQEVRSRAAHCLGLLDRARNHAALARQYPVLAQQTERAVPPPTATADLFAVKIEEIFRFGTEDTLVFRLRLENRTTAPIRYTPALLAIRIGAKVYPIAITDAGGEVPAAASEIVWLAITGEPDGRRANLSLNNTFTVVVPRLP